MKIYTDIYINPVSGDIEHAATSDAPLFRNMVSIKNITYSVRSFEFETDKFLTGRDALNNISLTGNTVDEKMHADSKLIINDNFKTKSTREITNVPDHIIEKEFRERTEKVRLKELKEITEKVRLK